MKLGPILLVPWVIACASAETPIPQATVEDSAGIRIVRSVAAAWDRGAAWRLPASPSVSIGAGIDDDVAAFSSIADAIRLEDSRIIVADRGNEEISIFTPSGEHLKTVGRRGDGPGEFRSLRSIGALPGDSFFAYDDQLVRVTIYDDTAGLVKVVKLPGYFAAVDRLADGRWVGATSEGHLGTGITPATPRGLLRPVGAVIVLDAAAAVADTIASVPGYEVFVGEIGGRAGVMPAPFGPTFSLAVRGGELLVSTGEALGFDVMSPAGELASRVRGPDLGVEVAPEDVVAYRDDMLAGMTEVVRQGLESLLDQAGMPAEKAMVSDLLTTPNGTVWLSAYQNARYYTGVWHVVDPSGAYLGRVQLPRAFVLLEAGDDYLLGKWRDDLGVSSIRLYPIETR